MTKISRALQGEAGNIMIQSIAGAIVSLVAMAGIIAGITGITQFQVQQSVRAEIATQAALTDSMFRSDALWAAAVKPVDAQRVEFTVPGRDGACESAVWSVGPSAGRTAVTVTNTTYPRLSIEDGAASCTGEPSEPVTTVLIPDAAPGSTFTYADAAGTALAFTGGHRDPTPEESTTPAAVALNTEVKASTERSTAFRFAQVSPHLAVPQVPDAAVHAVPGADLR